MGIKPEVCHLNEGHAAFAILERAKSYREETGCSFEVALSATRAGNLFTTHTAVPAGFDRFDPSFDERISGILCREASWYINARISSRSAVIDCKHSDEPFNMAYLAIRGSGAVNGVSRFTWRGESSDFCFSFSSLAH